jgi:hypothetical protein
MFLAEHFLIAPPQIQQRNETFKVGPGPERMGTHGVWGRYGPRPGHDTFGKIMASSTCSGVMSSRIRIARSTIGVSTHFCNIGRKKTPPCLTISNNASISWISGNSLVVECAQRLLRCLLRVEADLFGESAQSPQASKFSRSRRASATRQGSPEPAAYCLSSAASYTTLPCRSASR